MGETIFPADSVLREEAGTPENPVLP